MRGGESRSSGTTAGESWNIPSSSCSTQPSSPRCAGERGEGGVEATPPPLPSLDGDSLQPTSDRTQPQLRRGSPSSRSRSQGSQQGDGGLGGRTALLGRRRRRTPRRARPCLARAASWPTLASQPPPPGCTSQQCSCDPTPILVSLRDFRAGQVIRGARVGLRDVARSGCDLRHERRLQLQRQQLRPVHAGKEWVGLEVGGGWASGGELVHQQLDDPHRLLSAQSRR